MKSDVNEMKCDLKEYASIYARNTINVIGNGEELQSISKKNGFIVVITPFNDKNVQEEKKLFWRLEEASPRGMHTSVYVLLHVYTP